jgi:hypothetical protein
MIISTRNRQSRTKGERNDNESSQGSEYRVKVTGKYVVITPHYRNLASFSSIGQRGEVRGLSLSSAARMRGYLRDCVANYGVFITLTYPSGHGENGIRAKRDLKCFIQRYCRAAKSSSRSFSAFWFMEWQKRGAIHFHIYGTHELPKDTLARWWYEIVGSEDIRHLRAGTRIERIRSGRDGWVAYASKYASKSVQKVVPEGFGWSGRLWGVFGLRTTVVAATIIGGINQETVKKQKLYDCLRSEMYEYVRVGACKRLKTRLGMVVYVVNDKDFLYRIRLLVLMCQMESHLYMNDLYSDDEGLG